MNRMFFAVLGASAALAATAAAAVEPVDRPSWVEPRASSGAVLVGMFERPPELGGQEAGPERPAEQPRIAPEKPAPPTKEPATTAESGAKPAAEPGGGTPSPSPAFEPPLAAPPANPPPSAKPAARDETKIVPVPGTPTADAGTDAAPGVAAKKPNGRR
jgi:cytoskeleton protein RodZ